MARQTVKELREEIQRLDKALWQSSINVTKTINWIYKNYGYEAAFEAAIEVGVIDEEEARLIMACRGQRPS